MSSLAVQISQWESEERAHLVNQTFSVRGVEAYAKVAVELNRSLSRAPAPLVARPATAGQLLPLRQTAAELAGASGESMWEAEPYRTLPSSRRSLAEQGEAHSLRRRLMWEAEQQAKQDQAAVRPRQCTTQREFSSNFGVSGTSIRTAPEDRGNSSHQVPEDRAVCAALELAYVDGDIFFTPGGTVLRRSPSSKPGSPQQAKAHWSTTRGAGLRSPYISPHSALPTTTSSQDRPWR